MPQGLNQTRAARWIKQMVVGGSNLGAARPPLHMIPQATAPTAASEGSLHYNSTSKSLQYNNGTDDGAVGGLFTPVARTATAAGDGTGQIPEGATWVTVTTDSADKIITLPAPVVGTVIRIVNGATGYELRSSAPATVGINGGAEANAESAIAASLHVTCECVTATNWVCWSRAAGGTLAVVQVAAAA